MEQILEETSNKTIVDEDTSFKLPFLDWLKYNKQSLAPIQTHELEKQINTYLSLNGLHTLEKNSFYWGERSYPSGPIIIGISGTIIWNKTFYADIPFEVMLPNGKTFVYPLRINDNSLESFGVIYVVKIGSKFVLTNEFRIGKGDFLEGFPRGFPEKSETSKSIYINGIGFVGKEIFREFSEEVCSNIDFNSIKAKTLGRIFENSSTTTNAPNFIYINLPENSKINGGLENLNIKLATAKEINKKISSGTLCDSHSLSAWAIYNAKKIFLD